MDINGQRYDSVPAQQFDIGGTVIYVGYAAKGAATNASAWTIKKVALDASGNPTSVKWTAENASAWDNRTSESYT